jgi:hypothetical protein
MQGEVGWARPLCSSLQHYLEHIFLGLATDTQQEVARAVLARLLYRVEAAISAKKVSALGGLLLDRCVELVWERSGRKSRVSCSTGCSNAPTGYILKPAMCIHEPPSRNPIRTHGHKQEVVN